MKKKMLIITSVMLMIAITASLVLTSLAWFSAEYAGTQSLDFAVFSESIITMDLNGTDFYSDFRPAKAYEGAVASGLGVTDIFAAPFYYSEDEVTYELATAEQVQARLSLQYKDNSTYTLASDDQLDDALNDIDADKMYYFNGLSYTNATSAQMEAGRRLYVRTGEDIYTHADVADLTGSFIETKAQIGVVELQFAYYGSSTSSSVLKLSCQVASLWPNAPEDAQLVEHEEEGGGEGGGEGGEEEPNPRRFWLKDIGDEVSYMICVVGTGFDASDDLAVVDLPDTDIRILNETRTGFLDFSLAYAGSTMYLWDCNLDHDTLWGYFGINNYAQTVGTVTTTVTGSDITAYDMAFDGSWDDRNYHFSEESPADGRYPDSSFHYAAYNAVNSAYQSQHSVEFSYNNIGYAAVRSGNTNNYTIYQTTQGIGQMVTKTTMELKFYVFLWYNQVDELLSPNVSFGDVNLSITVDTTGE